ncbi:hypothetical protein PHLCEN_2v5938 [Hermanssonia centrifuga]|uniref:Uncharacterized protein n=1 Tax=Hermanssonia centrifuga TaxID=98765 RepID=A0A2R6P0V9_9APHY|nr:hypothetical protein PHLCEN_2v5938 [Hermanssonia centrifuga]
MASRSSIQATTMNPSTSSSSLSPTIVALADPPLRTMDGPAMDYFLIELVNTLRTSSAVAIARNKKIEQEMIDSGLLQPPPAVPPVVPAKRDSFASTSSKTDGKSDEEEEGLRLRLEAIGVHVGSNIAER